ncbi:glycosyltransferase family 2 protein [Thalassotalea litorea]|uniref:Glycosyltransferase family 2 protein n=1 Tax=Thalassotalea litorea TaxID=2020715 RepID=A0A5R9IJM2_9GAMM|nr:glycosyltransferase family A protein [Thalassotalea litorea]TLU64277.1 glycosyltransferase family 2 protein [Thalassotalea litorea]
MAINVSVIIPFYQRQAVFCQTIESVLKQTEKPSEIIIVNDASGGDSSEFLSQFSKVATIIELPKNVGVSMARNIGANMAKSKYLAFIDSDDIWEPEKLAIQYAYLEDNSSVDLVHTGCKMFGEFGQGAVYNNKPLNLTCKDICFKAHVMFQSVMMKTSSFRRVGGFDPSMRNTEDWEFSLRLAIGGCTQHFIATPLVGIRRDLNDHLSGNWIGYLKGHLKVMSKHKSLMQRHLGLYHYYEKLLTYIQVAGYRQKRVLGKVLIATALTLKAFNKLSLLIERENEDSLYQK